MQQRKLGSELEVSAIGLGCMSIDCDHAISVLKRTDLVRCSSRRRSRSCDRTLALLPGPPV